MADEVLKVSGAAVKHRAACDECRLKKLKCTGERPKCTRCVREGITCVYSVQKQMGRPKKRPRPEDTPLSALDHNDHLASEIYESTFTPGGNLQPWLQDGADWNAAFGLPHVNHGEKDINVPGLTPDNGSSYSPPMLDFPAELLGQHRDHVPHALTNHRDGSTALLLDPTLSSTNTLTPNTTSDLHIPTCACLSTMYLTLNTLSTMDPSMPFPHALHPLREAMQTATTVLSCPTCPTRFITAIQNVQVVGTLLMSIAERFSAILASITTESDRATAANETKKFRLADLNTSTQHLHTGGLGCVAAFSVDLSGEEWRKLCKKVVRAEVHGPESGNECCCYFVGVIEQMERRQMEWHDATKKAADCPKDDDGLMGRVRATINEENDSGEDAGSKHGDHLCLKLVGFARRLVDAFDWS